MLHMPPSGYPTTEQNLRIITPRQKVNTTLVLSPGKYRSVRSVPNEFQKKKSGISELSGFQNCTWTTKSSETRGTGNSGSRWLNEEKCFPPQVPGQKL